MLRSNWWGTALLVGAIACGGDGDGGEEPDGGQEPTIAIENDRYSPERIEVPPGAAIRVVNRDDGPHTVTSQSERDSFQYGEVEGVGFDTGFLYRGDLQAGPSSTRIFIPADARVGLVIPFFDHVLGPAGPQGEVVIVAP